VTTAEVSARQAVEAAWRIESPRLIAGLMRMVPDISVAEEVAQDALVAALEQWPASGVPRNPSAWLMTVAKRRLVDLLRRQQTLDQKVGLLQRDIESGAQEEQPDPEHIEDDLLRLMFVACHPMLSADARVALTLRLIGGLTTDEIARAYLVPEPTVAKRIVRAKQALAAANIPFEVPTGPDRAERLDSVLEVIYLIFNEGYSATEGDDWMRPELCAEALRVGRMLATLAPDEGEVHGLVALMEIHASRTPARTGPNGEVVRLLDQDRSRWNQLLIRRGLAAFDRAAAAGPLGPYAIQAAIAAEHGRARTADATSWRRISQLYEALAVVTPSPVVELNRAVAVGMAYGPDAALPIVDALNEHPLMQNYHLLPSVRGDLLEKLGRYAEAQVEFERAAALTRNERERTLLLNRAKESADAAVSLG
jgi:RNA polymerase sigma factor (sigma-70 family)